MYAEIEDIVSKNFGVTPDDIRGRKRDRNIEDARHFTWYVLSYALGYRIKVIAEEYGVSQRNVYYSVNAVHDGIRMQQFYSKNYKKLQREIRDRGLLQRKGRA